MSAPEAQSARPRLRACRSSFSPESSGQVGSVPCRPPRVTFDLTACSGSFLSPLLVVPPLSRLQSPACSPSLRGLGTASGGQELKGHLHVPLGCSRGVLARGQLTVTAVTGGAAPHQPRKGGRREVARPQWPCLNQVFLVRSCSVRCHELTRRPPKSRMSSLWVCLRIEKSLMQRTFFSS